MTIVKQPEPDGTLTLFLSGRIDTDTAQVLHEAVINIPPGTGRIVMDFRNVPLITSSGLRALLVCGKRFGIERMQLRNMGPEVLSTMKMVGFDSVFAIEETRPDVSTYSQMSFKELLAYYAREAGSRIVLKSPKESYTWNDIERASQIIAEDLSRLGVDTGSHVGICGANSVNWVLTFFAIQKLGAIAMLIQPAHSIQELLKICIGGDITCLCYGETEASKDENALFSRIRSAEGSRVSAFYSIGDHICLKDRFDEYEALKGKYEKKVESDSPCTVIFTSGSTGRPKGVILSSYNLLKAAAVQVKLQCMTAQDRLLLIVPLFHIFGLVACLFPCTLAGAVLYIPDNIHTDTLIRVMSDEKCTLMHSVPTMLSAIVNNRLFDPTAFLSLRCTYLAGMSASEYQIRMFRQKFQNDHFMIAYGLSEMAPVSVTFYEDSDDHIFHTAGKPVEDIEIKIVDPDTGVKCSTGENGEIRVRGFNQMLGYYKMSMEDQSIDEEGWLRTGDRGSLRQDGYLTLSGRYKDIIIRGGENIMPMEVENAVSALDMIENVKVFGVPSEFYGEEVAACLKLKDEAVFDEDAARVQLRSMLAKYKIPAYFIIFKEFPMLSSGKTDSEALKKAVIQRIEEMKKQ